MKFYQKAIGLSLLLHGLLVVLLLVSPAQHSAKTYVTKKNKSLKKQEIIKTTAIDSLQIDKEIKRIQTQKIQKKIQEQARQDELNLKVLHAKAERVKEEKALEQLKSERKKIAKAQKRTLSRQRKKLLALKKARLSENKRLVNSQKKRKALNKKLAEEKQQRMQDTLRQQTLEKEEAKRLALVKQKEEEKRLALVKAKSEAEAKQREDKQQLVNAQVNRYKALLINAISQNWILPPSADRSLSCRFEIKLVPSGVVQSVTLLRSSGDPVLDRSAQTAIYNASPLPVPSMPEAFEVFKVVSLTVKPETI